MVGKIHAGGVVNRIGVDAAAAQRVLDARLLGESQISAFDHDPGAQFGGDDPAGVVGMIAHLRVGFIAGANVGSDAAVVQHVNFGAQDRANQTVAIKLGGLDLKRGTHLRA